MIKEELGEVNYKIYKEVEKMSKIKGIQARLPYNIDIK
jgi:protease-4